MLNEISSLFLLSDLFDFVYSSLQSLSDFLPSDVKFVVQCERPNNQIHNFSGHM